jgi:hypothetical protein
MAAATTSEDLRTWLRPRTGDLSIEKEPETRADEQIQKVDEENS